MTASTRPRPTSTDSSLMQDVPGAYPIRTSTEENDEEQTAHLTLSQAVHARRAEYVRPKHVRIKVGTWNVAAHKGTEKDVGGWFVEGKGVEEALAGLEVSDQQQGREGVAEQEARYQRKQATTPKGDPGSLPGNDDIGLYVLGLQEVVDISSVTEAVRPYTDPAIANKWKDSIQAALPDGYQLVAEQQLIGLLILIYASAEVAPEVRSVSTTSVGTGLMGYMGNKGAVTARIVLGETTRMVFINSHLAAGADRAALERRNWDAAQIVQRTKFEPIQEAMDLAQTTGEQIGDEDFAFWMGDLNYRLEGIPGDDVRRLLMLHTRNEYDMSHQSAGKIDEQISEASASIEQRKGHTRGASSTSSGMASSVKTSNDNPRTEPGALPEPSAFEDELEPSEDPTSLQTTLSSLLPHDELHQQMQARKAFHDGWREGTIAFLPTYKYDAGSVGVFDSSEKKRAPSWCDRILYRTRRDKLAYEAKVKEEERAKKKDEEMKLNGMDQAGDDEEILYDYDPETDGARANDDDYDQYDEYESAEDGVVITKEGFEDEIGLEYYTAHQRVLSSDHKPLNAVFMLKYDAVVPELKAKIHAEVAKDLDKAENEARPNVTVVVDQHNDTQTEQCDETHKDFEGVWFGSVRWAQSKHRSLTVANTSRVPASFNFIERPVGPGQSSGIAPTWLKIGLNGISLDSSSTATAPVPIEPGETVVIELEMRIFDMGLVQALNEGLKGLDDILVLRVEGGRDHFVPVRAKWLDTSLARSIDKLIRIPEGGIRKLQSQRPDRSKSREGSSSKTGSRRASAAVGDAAEDPVRFSAPRELFRLTEAVEELCTRVVAEWEMTAEKGDTAPWSLHPGWPFEEECWTEKSTAAWEDAMGEVCNALDLDQPLDVDAMQEVPRTQRLYALASFTLLFLSNIPEGIVTEDRWTQIDTCFADWEKSKRKPTNEEQRTAVQEILSHSASHSISFILITAMLERILSDIAGASKTEDASPTTPSPKRPGGTLRRMTGGLGKVSAVPYKEQATNAFARIFARAMVRAPQTGHRKGPAVQEKRRVQLMEIFLRKGEPG